MSKYRKMNPEWKAKWIAALRSKEFKQGRLRLYNREDNSYCCLGVLQKIVDPDSLFMYGSFPTISTLRTAGLLEEFKVRHVEPEFQWPGDPCYRLSQLNDTKWYTFDQIADWIEEHL